MDGTLKENESVRAQDFLSVSCYRILPQAHSSECRHQVYGDDGDLHLCHINPAETAHIYGRCGVLFFLIWQEGRRNLQAEAHGPGDIGLPLGAEEHEHPHKTAEEHPIRVQANSAGNAGSHGNKD